jgi:hypothetical protein
MEDEEECDPSKFSFFEVPEFTARKDGPDGDYFETRLRELVRMTGGGDGGAEPAAAPRVADDRAEAAGREATNKAFSDPRFLREGSCQTLSTFGQADRSPGSDWPLEPEPGLTDHSPADCSMDSPSPLPSPPGEPLTPQKQFLLLSHSLRHPDGSSNPDINLGLGGAKRSPGNGQSSSDQEDEIRLHLTSYTDAVNGNEACNGRPVGGGPTEAPRPKKKESNNIAARLFRLFGSSRKKNLNKIDCQRSKSCDRELEESLPKYKEVLQKDFRSASSSPLKQRDKHKKDKAKAVKESKADKARKGRREGNLMETSGTPSTLSLAPTEWEYQQQEEDARNGNPAEMYGSLSGGSGRLAFLAGSSLQELRAAAQDRKSSGYDSLEGESSSLDSSHDNGELRNGNPGQAVEYAVPSDQREGGLHYDEVNQLKMEIKRHPNILRRDY